MDENKENSVYSETAYDDAFRTMEGKCDDILIPFVGHVFGISYGDKAEVKRLRNEQFMERKDEAGEKRITDSSFEITDNEITKRFHLECESKKYDGTILIRLFEYDAQIARGDNEGGFYKVRFNFPNSGILLLRYSNKAPAIARIELSMPDGKEISYDVPIIKMSDYDIEDIFRERLYMLIPFYIFNYEARLPEINTSEAMLDDLVKKYNEIFESLEKEHEKGNLSALSLSVIIKLTYSVAYKLTMKQEHVQKKVGDVMGGKVLDLPEFHIYEQGKAQGKAEGEEERKALEQEIVRLRREIELLKAAKAN